MAKTADTRPPYLDLEATPLYAVTVHQGIASGDLWRMRELETEPAKHLVDHGSVAEGLGYLKAAIAKLKGST
jgi:hypothetical protein